MAQEVQKIEIQASNKKCYDVICDFLNYPKWQKNVEKVNVLDSENNRPTVVEYQINAIMKTVTYTLQYNYTEKNTKEKKIEWTYIGGDVKNIEGYYIFEEIAENKTLATYSLALELGFSVPQFLLNRMKTASMKETLEALKNRAENQN